MKNENIFLEECRIRIAKELNKPPDDIDLESIIKCCKRAIIGGCNNKDGSQFINPLSKKEEKALFSNYGFIIVGKIFSGEYPFFSWAEKFEEDYVENYLKDINNMEN